MRNYQRQKNNPYKLPDGLYRRMIDLVRDYERIKQQRENIVNDATENKAIKLIKLAVLNQDCEAIEKALAKIPKEYHKGIMDNILYHAKYPYIAAERTYSYQKSRFIYFIAENLNQI